MIDDLIGDDFMAAKHAARSGKYQLLLGAGASLGAKNKFDRPLLGAGDLVRAFAKQYPDAYITDDLSLQRAYQRAVRSSSSGTVWTFLKRLYDGSKHEEWFTHLADLPWRRVWTLNVDDTFENAFKKTIRSRTAKLRAVNFTDEYAESKGLEIVHLHGSVKGSDPTPLVFSLSEYQSTAEARGVWYRVLKGLVSAEPFIIMGARILGDQDVEALVLGSTPSADFPSIIVDPFISEGCRWELQQAGYYVAQCTGHDFVAQWSSMFALERANLSAFYNTESINLPQMHRLSEEYIPPLPKVHDFLGGSEPLWADACSDKIAPFDWMRQVQNFMKNWVQTRSHGIFVQVLYADRLAGISSGLLHLSRSATRSSFTVLMFDKSVRFDANVFLDYCRSLLGPVLLIIDGVSEFASDVDKLGKEAEFDPEILLFVLVTDRPSKVLRVEDQLRGTYPKHAITVALRRSKKDANSIVRLLAKAGRLGRLEEANTNERVQAFAGRDIFSSMAEVEHSPGFRSRLDVEIAGLSEGWHKNLMLLLSLASLENISVGILEASFAVNVSTQSLRSAILNDEHLAALVELSSEILYPRQRQRVLASLVATANGYNFLDQLSLLLINLSPLATKEGLYGRDRANVLTGRLMSAKQLRQTFPNGNLPKFYESLFEKFGSWNARYWEQRAIEAKQREDWGPAESFAERAVSLNDDTFTRTTLGTILINKSQSLASEGDPAWVSYYERGYGELREAIDRGSANRVTAFAYLDASLNLLEVLSSRVLRGLTTSGHAEGLHADWRSVYTIMRIGLNFKDGFVSNQRAEQLSQRFERLTGNSTTLWAVDVGDEAEDVMTQDAGMGPSSTSTGASSTSGLSCSSEGGASRVFGFISWVHEHGAYGFVKPDEGSPDVFIHVKEFDPKIRGKLILGQRISYTVVTGTKGFAAAEVKVV